MLFKALFVESCSFLVFQTFYVIKFLEFYVLMFDSRLNKIH